MNAKLSQSVYAAEMPSNCECMPQIIDEVVATLHGLGAINRAQEPKIRICMQEAIVNAIRHGNNGELAKMVRVEVRQDSTGCSILLYDEGDGFDPIQIATPDTGSAGGRGLCLMQHFVDSVAFDASAKCLELRLNAPQKAQGE